jgi:hypothetical protein
MTRPVDAMSTALTRTRRVLFEPFDVGKYVAVGFCVWLSQLGNAVGAGSRIGGRSSGSGGGPDEWREVMHGLDWLAAWGPMLAAWAAVAALVGAAVWALILFVQSRGLFMVIDDVVHDRGEVVTPWRAWAGEASALFRFRFVVNLGAAAVAVIAATIAGSAVWWTWDGALEPLQVGILSVAGLVAGVVGLLAAIADACAREFVAPMMYVRRYAVADGFRDLWAYVRRDPGGFLVYVVLRLGAALVVALIAAALSCFTCGLVVVPFLGTLILLPALLFLRAFSLDFVAQLSDDLSSLSP